jgi:hypothetical protein
MSGKRQDRVTASADTADGMWDIIYSSDPGEQSFISPSRGLKLFLSTNCILPAIVDQFGAKLIRISDFGIRKLIRISDFGIRIFAKNDACRCTDLLPEILANEESGVSLREP